MIVVLSVWNDNPTSIVRGEQHAHRGGAILCASFVRVFESDMSSLIRAHKNYHQHTESSGKHAKLNNNTPSADALPEASGLKTTKPWQEKSHHERYADSQAQHAHSA